MSTQHSYLDQLNEAQRLAVEYIDGPELVIAGAGSGKTRVLTYKIVHLLAHGYEPWRIMALTFTNKAAREMRERIEALAGADVAKKLWMGTFHSIFARILRINAERLGFRSNFTIYDSADSQRLVKNIIKEMALDDKVYKPSTVAALISSAKNSLMSPAEYAADRQIADRDRLHDRRKMPEVYAAYVNRCRIAGAMDFDDLLVYTHALLRDNGELRRHYQEYFRYILVDEYQDTNYAQHQIVTLLCADNAQQQKLCVVGDDAQSIYSFRGACIDNILTLKRSFPNLRTFKLEANYRSTENIIDAASALIAHNRNQIPKDVHAASGLAGQKVELVKSYSDYEESYLVASRVAQLHRMTGDGYDEFAVLYRTNAQSRLLEEALRKRDIPYRIYGGHSFYQRAEIKNVIAYFRLAVNPDDDEALRRVINFPARGIGETTVGKLNAAANAAGVSLWTVCNDPAAFGVKINKGTAAKIGGFTELIQRLFSMSVKGQPAQEIADHVYAATGMLAQYADDGTPENVTRRENIEELRSSVYEFVAQRTEEGNPEQATINDYLADVSLQTDVDEVDATDTDAPKVTLMTIHAAKGLEFGNIIVVGVEEDLIPSGRGEPSEIEEERRLLYVAITRAKRYCMLTYAGTRYRNGQTVAALPSRFISEIGPKLLNCVSGTTIEKPAPQIFERPKFAPRPSYNVAPPTPKPSAEDADLQHSVNDVKPGQRIEHTRFGMGVVDSVDADNPTGARILATFENGEHKTLLLRFARFKIL